MRMFNADGSEGEMCGNGVRCVAKYAFDHGLTKSNPMKIETGRGVLTLDLLTQGGKVASVTVNMAEPILALPEIPVDPAQLTCARGEHKNIGFKSPRLAIITSRSTTPPSCRWATRTRSCSLTM